MVNEEIIIQTADEVSTIDYMKTTNDMLSEHNDTIQDNISTISEQLDIIMSNTNNLTGDIITPTSTDLSEVTELIEDIDTSVVESTTQDILVKINRQQEQINEINEKIDMILEKL